MHLDPDNRGQTSYLSLMNTLETAQAHGLFAEALEQGGTGNEVARQAEKKAEEIDKLRNEIADQSQSAVGETVIQSSERLPSTPVVSSPPKNVEDMRELAESGAVDLEQVSNTMKKTAADVRSTVGATTNKELDEGVGGQAYQGAPGSAIVDVEKAVRSDAPNGSLVEKGQLDNHTAHEKVHEQQSNTPNAESVDVGHGKKLTWHNVSEADAMAGKTLRYVSSDYKRIYRDVTAMASEESVRKAAKTGDLVGLGRQIRRQQGLPSDQESFSTSA